MKYYTCLNKLAHWIIEIPPIINNKELSFLMPLKYNTRTRMVWLIDQLNDTYPSDKKIKFHNNNQEWQETLQRWSHQFGDTETLCMTINWL